MSSRSWPPLRFLASAWNDVCFLHGHDTSGGPTPRARDVAAQLCSPSAGDDIGGSSDTRSPAHGRRWQPSLLPARLLRALEDCRYLPPSPPARHGVRVGGPPGTTVSEDGREVDSRP